MGVFRRGKIAAFLVMLLFLFPACSDKKEKEKFDIDFTVCNDTSLPGELKKIIEEKKDKVFKLSYINNSYMYIAVGYGEMPRANYNVSVENLYATSQCVFFETNLLTEEMSPTDAIPRGESSMYPYIVVKCEKFNVPVIYDLE